MSKQRKQNIHKGKRKSLSKLCNTVLDNKLSDVEFDRYFIQITETYIKLSNLNDEILDIIDESDSETIELRMNLRISMVI